MRTLLTAFALLIISCQRQASDNLRPEQGAVKEIKFYNQNKNFPKHEKGVVLFKLKNNSSLSRVAGRSTTERVFTKAMQKAGDNGFYKIRIHDEQKALNDLRNNPEVEWASLNYTETTQTTPDDPHWSNGNLWGMANIGMPAVWQSGNFGNKQVYVGVIDEGIFGHEDLCQNIWTNPYEQDNGIDDDGNGYIDDFHGWDWFNNDNEVYPGATHGTHVAGTIGAKGGNQKGVIGVASNVTLISCKFLEQYGFDANAVLAIDYLIDLKQRHGLNIKVTSNSWGGGGFNPGLLEAIQRARDADILFVAAAGNHAANNDVQPNFPCGYDVDNIISVGASQWDNSKASFSCWGPTTVDIFAPGVNTVSTVPSEQHTSGYAFFSGTSMATPHVSGAAALFAGINPDANYLQIKNAILSAAHPVPALQGLCVTGGILNVSSFTGQTAEHQPPFYDCPTLTPDNIPPTTPTNFEVYEVGFDPRPGAFYGGYFGIRWSPSTDNTGVAAYVLVENGQGTWYLAGTNYVIAGIQDTSQVIIAQVYAIDAWGNVSGMSNTDTVDWNAVAPPPDPTPCNITSSLNATSQSLKVTLSWSNTVTGSCNISSIRLERKKGGTASYSVVAFNPTSPHQDNVPNPGNYTYRLQIVSSTGQTFYSNEKTIKVNKK